MQCIMHPNYKRFFIIHVPKVIKYLFQIRMNISPLRSHKKYHNFPCNQGIEDTRHFVCGCLKFATHRGSLAVTVTGALCRNNLMELANNL